MENCLIILRCLKGNKNYGIKFTNDRNFKIYVNANYEDEDTKESTTEYIINFGNWNIPLFLKL